MEVNKHHFNAKDVIRIKILYQIQEIVVKLVELPKGNGKSGYQRQWRLAFLGKREPSGTEKGNRGIYTR